MNIQFVPKELRSDKMWTAARRERDEIGSEWWSGYM